MSQDLQIQGEQIAVENNLQWQRYYADTIEELYPRLPKAEVVTAISKIKESKNNVTRKKSNRR